MQAVVFPFDLFGGAGTGSRAQLLGDALREMLADAKRETQPSRCRVYRDHVRIKELEFDTPGKCRAWRETGRSLIQSARKSNKPVLWLAGNHLAVLPVYEELGADSLILQFDAHLDIYNLADCTTELSHGNFLLHADKPLPRIVNIGSRDLFLPTKHALEHFQRVHTTEEIVCDLPQVCRQLSEAVKNAKRVWIDIDCDVFDPAFVPAVQHPQPMGLPPLILIQILAAIWSDKVIGLSLSEFDSGRDRGDMSLHTLVWLIEWCLLRWFES